MAVVKVRRYHSPTRQMRLEATKAAIVSAAIDLMARQGYLGTTMEQIAASAGVAVQTVYKHFGSKAAIVKAFILQIRGDERLTIQRRRLLEAADPREQVRLIAERARMYAELGVHAYGLPGGGTLDLELAAAWRQLGEDVRRSHLDYVRSLDAKGALRAGVSTEQAADYLLICHPELFSLVWRARGWTLDQWEAWLVETLTRLLLD